MVPRPAAGLAVALVTALTLTSLGLAGAVEPQGSDEAEALAKGYPVGPPRVPIGYDPAPKTPALGVSRPRIDGPGFSARITNRGAVAFDRLRFVAVVERVGWRERVRILDSMTWAVVVPPGETIEIASDWLKAADLDRLMVDDQARPQIYLSPAHVHYADGSEWNVSIDPTATTFIRALGPKLP